jgi:signal transduction histidine kinase
MSHIGPSRGSTTSDRRARGKFPLRLRGLTIQIVLWTVLPLTLVLIGVAFTGVYSHEQSMQRLVQERDQALAVVNAAQASDRLQEQTEALEELAAEQAFHHQDYTAQQTLLAQAGDLDGLFVDSAALVDESGSLIVSVSPPPAWTRDTRLAELARLVMARQDIAIVSPFDASWGKDVMLVGLPVRDETGTTYGVLAAPMSSRSLELGSLLSQVQVGEQGAVYLVDSAGRILLRAPEAKARSSFAGHTGISVALEDDEPGATLCHGPDGERMALAYAPIEYGGLGWRVLIEEPWHQVVGPVLRYSQFVPLVAVLAAVVSVLALYYGVRSIVRPLQALGQQAERVAWGDFEATGSPVGGVEEIEDLRRTLDQMVGRIQSYQHGMHDYIAIITEGQEEERKRLARELHDDTAQALIALNQQVEMAQKLLITDPDRAAERLATVRSMLAETIEGVRRFSRDLRPIYLEDLGFIPALEMMAQEADHRESLDVHFITSGQVRRLTPDLELAAYRIVQEALNNVIQHAGANDAWVEVRFTDRQLLLSVRDDGQGFEAPDLPDALARQGHFGLMGIQERALLYGGQLAIRSMPSEGTEITVSLPYPPQG